MGFQRKANQHAGILSQPCCGWLRGCRLWEMLKIAHGQKTELSGLPHYFYRSQGVPSPQLGTPALAQSPLMLQMKEGVSPSGCVPTGDWFRGWGQEGRQEGCRVPLLTCPPSPGCVPGRGLEIPERSDE